MQASVLIIAILLLSSPSCKQEQQPEQAQPSSQQVFNKSKWRMKDGYAYPYRENMLNDVVYNDTIRSLNQDQITQLLGEPDKIREHHYYYNITREKIGYFTLHAKTMVIKFRNEDTIEWIKIHE